jgi:hypothetical protein
MSQNEVVHIIPNLVTGPLERRVSLLIYFAPPLSATFVAVPRLRGHRTRAVSDSTPRKYGARRTAHLRLDDKVAGQLRDAMQELEQARVAVVKMNPHCHAQAANEVELVGS